MPYLTSSSSRQRDSSGGALQIDSIEPWAPSPSEETTQTRGTTPHFLLGWEQLLPGARVAHEIRFHLQETAARPEYSRLLLSRLLCHYLINRIPDKGIPELFESVGRIYRFYSTAPRTLPPSLPMSKVAGKIGRLSKRPDFHVDEE